MVRVALHIARKTQDKGPPPSTQRNTVKNALNTRNRSFLNAKPPRSFLVFQKRSSSCIQMYVYSFLLIHNRCRVFFKRSPNLDQGQQPDPPRRSALPRCIRCPRPHQGIPILSIIICPHRHEDDSTIINWQKVQVTRLANQRELSTIRTLARQNFGAVLGAQTVTSQKKTREPLHL